LGNPATQKASGNRMTVLFEKAMHASPGTPDLAIG
jgi:hypothetical protein